MNTLRKISAPDAPMTSTPTKNVSDRASLLGHTVRFAACPTAIDDASAGRNVPDKISSASDVDMVSLLTGNFFLHSLQNWVRESRRAETHPLEPLRPLGTNIRSCSALALAVSLHRHGQPVPVHFDRDPSRVNKGRWRSE